MSIVIVSVLKIFLNSENNQLFSGILFLICGCLLFLKAKQSPLIFKKSSVKEIPTAIDISLSVFLALVGISILLCKMIGKYEIVQFIDRYFSTGIYLSLFIMSLSLLIIKKHPFTMAYLLVRGHKIDNEQTYHIYYRTMCELSAFWAVIFLAAAIITIIEMPIVRDVISIIFVSIFGFVIGNSFLKWRIQNLSSNGGNILS